jgi:ribitol-5-phosphate 2-dehydrogenase (NADP+) / D-ribitol-5-phosphate cytidylyltransferase
MVVFGGTSGIGQAIVDLARDWGADVFSFSRVGDHATPMRTKALGVEPEGSLLTSEQVAEVSLTVITFV